MARELGISFEKVCALLDCYGLEAQPDVYKRKLPPFEELKRLVATQSTKTIAETYGVSRPAVYRAMDRGGFELKRGIWVRYDAEPTEDERLWAEAQKRHNAKYPKPTNADLIAGLEAGSIPSTHEHT